MKVKAWKCSGTVTVTTHSRQPTDSTQPYPNTKGTLHRIRTDNFNTCIETQKTPSGQNNLRKKNRAGGITLLDFWLYRKATVINAVWDWQRNRCTDQHDRTHSPEINPHTCGQLSHNTGGKNTQQRKHSLFNKRCWENWTATCKRRKWAHFFTPHTKINSKWIKRLKYTTKTHKTPRRKHRQNTVWYKW